MLLFRKYHFSKDSGVITYVYMFCIHQCKAGQLSEIQFRVVELETMINTHDIGTFFWGGGTPNLLVQPLQVRKAFVFQVGLPEVEAKLSLPLLSP